MPDGIQLRIDDRKLRRELARFGKRAEDGRKPLGWFYQWWKVIVSAEWNKVKVTGGTFRGKKWEALKPLYRRKDGTEIPAWGGVAKATSVEVTRNGKTFTRRLKARGKVKGRRRTGRTGVRVRRTDILNVDTQRLRGAMLAARAKILQRVILRIGSDLPAYAAHVFINLKRNPLFWKLPEDARNLKKAGEEYLKVLIREWNSRG